MDLQLFATKLTEKVLDRSYAEEYYNSYLKRKNKKSAIIDHPRMSHKFSKTVRQTEKVSQVGPSKSSINSFYIETKKTRTFFKRKNVKIAKQAHAFEGYASSYNAEILNSFNSELQLEDTESAIKKN